jgi:thiol:disulfide interchange protein DsbA
MRKAYGKGRAKCAYALVFFASGTSAPWSHSQWSLCIPARMMTIDRRSFSGRVLAAAAICCGASLAARPVKAQGSAPVEGTQYRRLPKRQATGSPGKIEVLEFFSYACPHCFELEPLLEPWVRKLPTDVKFQRVPVPFLVSSANLMKSYYAFEALGIVDLMTPVVFSAMNVAHQRLGTPEEVAALVAKNGGDSAKFLATINSFGVANNVVRAKKLLDSYDVDSTPTFAIQGLYETSPALAGGHPQALAVVDLLVSRARHDAT